MSKQESHEVQQVTSLPLGKNNPMHLFMLWVDQLERSFLEKALGVLVNTKINMCP